MKTNQQRFEDRNGNEGFGETNGQDSQLKKRKKERRQKYKVKNQKFHQLGDFDEFEGMDDFEGFDDFQGFEDFS